MSLEQWLQSAWIKRHDSTLPEIQKLLQVVDRELQCPDFAKMVGVSGLGFAA